MKTFLLLALAVVSAALGAPPQDLRLTDGSVLKGARIVRVEGAWVTIAHAGGESTVPLRRLDEARQRELQRPLVDSSVLFRRSPGEPEEVVVTATALPIVEPFGLIPENAALRAYFEDLAKKKALRDAKEAPKNFFTLPIWEKVPFTLATVRSPVDEKPASTFRWQLHERSAQTYGAPDPRTGK